MEDQEIKEGVGQALRQWSRARGPFNRSAELTNGAVATLIMIIKNINADPSPHWSNDFDFDAAQRRAISLIPDVLNDLTERMPIPTREQTISSWELYHGISLALDTWCFIPKDV